MQQNSDWLMPIFLSFFDLPLFYILFQVICIDAFQRFRTCAQVVFADGLVTR